MSNQNNVHLCKIIRIEPTFVIIEFNQHQAICHISEVSDYHVHDLHDFFKIGSSYNFLLIGSDPINHKYKFSYKQINAKLLRHHRETIPTASGFKNLYDNTMTLLNQRR